MSLPSFTAQDSEASSSPSATLKRGDACLPCRRRRIKCTAERPSCATCSRLSKHCVYDDGQPRSRIRKLKDRIAELEQHLAPPASPQSTAEAPPSTATRQIGSYTDILSEQTFSTSQLSPFPPPAQHAVSAASESIGSSNAPQSSNPRPLQTPSATFDFDFALLDSTIMDLAAETQDTSLLGPSSVSTAVPDLACDSMWMNDYGASNMHSGAGPSHMAEVVGGWFDPNDIPPHIRDHLLDLFFSRQDFVGAGFHVGRFYSRLTMAPSKRPHPCFLYAIYLTGASSSSQPSLRRLEPVFLKIAEEQLRTAIAMTDRSLDAVRATAILASYHFTRDQFAYGYNLSGTAIRLALACGLHRVQSSVWKPAKPLNPAVQFMLRPEGYLLRDPEDSIELGERIAAFWAVYELDMCTAVAYLWQRALRFEDILTPLPKPIENFASNLVSEADDETIASFLDSAREPRVHSNGFLGLRLKALTLLVRATELRALPPEAHPGPKPRIHSRATFSCCPTAFASVKQALDTFSDGLPQDYRLPWRRMDEGSDTDLSKFIMGRHSAVIACLVSSAYLAIWNVKALDAENRVAVLVARRIVNFILSLTAHFMPRGYDAFLIALWSDVAMVLLREIMRLRFSGETAQAITAVEADYTIVTGALKQWASSTLTNDHEDADIAAINLSGMERLRSMTAAEWAQAVRDAEGQFAV